MAIKLQNDLCGCPPCAVNAVFITGFSLTYPGGIATTGGATMACIDPATGATIPFGFDSPPYPTSAGMDNEAACPLIRGGRVGFAKFILSGSVSEARLAALDVTTGAEVFNLSLATVSSSTLYVHIDAITSDGVDWFALVRYAARGFPAYNSPSDDVNTTNRNELVRVTYNEMTEAWEFATIATFRARTSGSNFFNTGTQGYILVGSNGLLYVSGGFLTVNGTSRQRLACLATDGTLQTGFDCAITAASSFGGQSPSFGPWSLIEHDGKIYTHHWGNQGQTWRLKFGGVERRVMAAVDMVTGALDSGFDPFADSNSGTVFGPDTNVQLIGPPILRRKLYPNPLPSPPPGEEFVTWFVFQTVVYDSSVNSISPGAMVNAETGEISQIPCPSPFWSSGFDGQQQARLAVYGDSWIIFPYTGFANPVQGGREWLLLIDGEGNFITDDTYRPEAFGYIETGEGT